MAFYNHQNRSIIYLMVCDIYRKTGQVKHEREKNLIERKKEQRL